MIFFTSPKRIPLRGEDKESGLNTQYDWIAVAISIYARPSRRRNVSTYIVSAPLLYAIDQIPKIH